MSFTSGGYYVLRPMDRPEQMDAHLLPENTVRVRLSL